MKKIHTAIKIVLAMLVAALVGSGGYYAYLYILSLHHEAYMSTFYCTENMGYLSNPYCGFYNIYSYMLSDDLTFDEKLAYEDDENALALIEVNLVRYRDGKISKKGLNALDTLFEAWSCEGKDLIVRFLYDWDGKGELYEPDDLSTVITHIEQTCKVLNLHKDIVYILQGVYVGSYAEMHDSSFLGKDDLDTLINAIYEATDPSIYLSVRTPSYWRKITKKDTIDPADAFGTALDARLSLFNDGLMGSESDLGTYDDREDELSFQNTLCRYVPNGGEVIIDNEYNDIDNAVNTLSEMRVSYLNDEYDDEVLEKWKISEYDGETGYEYIRNHLGYRYLVTQVSVENNDMDFFSKNFTLDISISNTGFSPIYKKADLILHIKNDETDLEYPLEADLRYIPDDNPLDASLSLSFDDLPEGSYQLSLSASSEGKSLLFANEGASDSLYLGELSVE